MEPFENTSLAGPWAPAEIAAHLDESRIPIRLAALPKSGWPLLVSLWFVRDGSDILCTTQDGSAIAKALAHDARCAFEIARDDPPYHGVRGRASCAVEAGSEPLLIQALERYLGTAESGLARSLRANKRSEVTLRLTPTRLVTWDYRERMAGSMDDELD